jgi:hypothetical protein
VLGGKVSCNSFSSLAYSVRRSLSVDCTYACVMSLSSQCMLYDAIRDAPSNSRSCWLIRWIVSDWVRISSLPLSEWPASTSLDFLYSWVFFPLTSRMSCKLKILLYCTFGLYRRISNVLLVMSVSISVRSDSSKGRPVVVIIPS